MHIKIFEFNNSRIQINPFVDISISLVAIAVVEYDKPQGINLVASNRCIWVEGLSKINQILKPEETKSQENSH